MKHFDQIYEIAVDQYGLVSAAQAKEIGVVGAELNRYVSDGRLVKRGYGLYKLVHYVPTEYDFYAEAVALVGDGAYLFGESVLAMHNLALVNPAKITVATKRRVRRKLPSWILVRKEEFSYKIVKDAGIPSQTVADALRSCKVSVMPDRLFQAAHDARSQGLITQAEYESVIKELK